MNHNSGLLFAKASVDENRTLNAKSLKNPYLFTMADGTFGILAIRTGHDGEHDPESKGCVLIFRSSDFISYQEIGLIPLNGNNYVSDAICEYNCDLQHYEISWRDDSGNY
ncbi:MAG TPA: hypothetical protein VL921_22195 [Candidatus Udaeobacter sp.]|nr:hypothetical protein [Candidatus Udaeobacter sp.]